MKKHRNSSIELLRLILMFMIVCHHGIVMGCDLITFAPNSSGILPLSLMTDIGFLFFINAFLISAVNCFVFISGFYGIKTTKKKFINILSLVLFYTVLFTIIPELCDKNWKGALVNTFFLSHSRYWFIVDYIFLMCLAPYINKWFLRKDKNQKFLIIALTIITVYFGFIWGHRANNNGYTLVQFIYLYSLGRFISLYAYKIKLTPSIYLFLICSCVNGIAMYYLANSGKGNWAWRLTYYNNPLIIISAVCLFFIFYNIHFYSKLINAISKSALAIYLFQCSSWISDAYYSYIQNINLKIVENFNHIGKNIRALDACVGGVLR